MSTSTFSLPPQQVKRLLDGIAHNTRQSTPELLEGVAGLWATDLVRQTWPKKVSDGTRRVAKDIDRIVMERDADVLAEWEAVARGVTYPARIFRRKDGTVYGVDNTLIMFDGSKLGEHHESLRSPTTGRVTRAGDYDRTVGRWKFINRAVVPGNVKRKFIKEKQKSVGKLKAGWWTGGRWGSKAPSWVTRHGTTHSTAIDTLDRHSLSGEIGVENKVPYAERKIKGIVELTLRKRVRDLTGGFYAKRWQKQMEKRINTGVA